MLITVLLPEFVMAHGFSDFSSALSAMGRIARWKTVHYPWWYSGIQRKGQRDSQNTSWTLTHCYFANMGGFIYNDGILYFPLTADMLAKDWDLLDMHEISEDDIKRKSKTDNFAKAIAILQISQLVLSLIVRRAEQLHFSQLEAVTLQFAACGIITYTIYWYKPQNVETPIFIKCRNNEHRLHPERLDSLWGFMTNKRISPRENASMERINNDNIPPTVIPALSALSIAVGTLHLIAWNFEFPTALERILWRVATVLSITIPSIGLLSIPLALMTISAGDPREFMRNCLRAMREFSWYAADNKPILEAYDKLEKIYNDPNPDGESARVFYGAILGGEQGVEYPLHWEMLKYIQKNSPYMDRAPLDLPEKFSRQFEALVRLIDGNGPKILVDNAKTNVFPQKTLLSQAVPIILSLLYPASFIYSLARLTIIAVAFSSLRSMPGDVYTTTWARVIPALG
jgi:hypothetical protein